jgi:DNA-binding SARP family transcriptional activator
MFLIAKLTAPRPDYPSFGQPVLNRVFERAVTLFIAPDGYLLTDSLASVLVEQKLPICWLRLGLEDCDPGTLLLSLVSSLQRIYPGVGLATFSRMRRQPGPVVGWEPHFGQLAGEFSSVLPRGSMLVLENVENLAYSPATLNYLGSHFLPFLRDDIHTILISQERLPRASLPPKTQLIDLHDLRLDENVGIGNVLRMDAGMTPACINRSIWLTEGRVTALASLLQASILLGPALVEQEVKRAANMEDLLAHIARASLDGADDNALQSLALAIRLEYSHPSLRRSMQPIGPWLQPLSDGWDHMRSLWNRPLRKVLRTKSAPNNNTVRQAASLLAGQNAYFQAVNLYFETRDTASAARTIAKMADNMMDLGQWATLNAWMKRLPARDLEEWPWLVYVAGKISAAQGHLEPARQSFAASTSIFSHQQDPKGICLSLLAESALAAWRGDITHAKERALTAHIMAQRASLNWYQSWAAWQLGSLAANAGELEEALQWFGPAAALADQAGNYSVGEMLHLAEKLITRQRDLLRQRKAHEQAYLDMQRAEKEISARLQNLLNSPPENLDNLLETHGWTHVPLLPISSAFVQSMPGQKGDGFAFNFMETLANVLKPQPVRTASQSDASLLLQNWKSDLLDLAPPVIPATGITNSESVLVSSPPPASQRDIPAQGSQSRAEKENHSERQKQLLSKRAGRAHSTSQNHTNGFKKNPPSRQLSLIPTLRICLLGQFRVQMADLPLADWSNSRARSIFKYLVIHRDQAIQREVLMDTFWPSASPESARNNLNVAMHNLRAALHSTTAHPFVLFRDGAYQLDPSLALWVDVDEFEKHVQEGHRLEADGDPAGAMDEYEAGVDLYSGDFLSDDPYEEWPVLIRERLRVSYLDTLDRLSQMYFLRDEYNACITLCQLILGNDACREDAHCRLMRCYSRLGQDHLALRQYQVCVDALRAELDVNPAPVTISLYEKIRNHDPL